MPDRRAFLHASSLLALSGPRLLARAAPPGRDARALVVVQLDGGNDALNTVVPHSDPAYVRLRPRLRLSKAALVPLTPALGLHPELRPLGPLLEAGHLAVLPGVGYPASSRSHFEGMAVWHTARADREGRAGHGWLGRALDPTGGLGLAVGPEVPASLRGRRSSATALGRLEDLQAADRPGLERAAGPAGAGEAREGLLGFARGQTLEAARAAERLGRVAAGPGGAVYPDTELAGRLRLVARAIAADLGVRVFTTTQTGYDTHATQAPAHATLLGEFAGAVAAFFADLGAAGLAGRVTLLAFSEFGRTVKENGSGGTDHGTAGVMFLAGPGVRGGVAGSMPDLTDLEAGEPRATTDFRAVYAAVLEGWLGGPAAPVVGEGVRPLPLFR